MDRLTFEAAYELDGNTLSGVAHVFGETAIKGGVPQRFAPGAFLRSIRNKAPIAFYSHDTAKPLASMSAGTLDVFERQGKLHFRMDLGAQSYANDLRENHAAGLMRSMSFGVQPVKWDMVKEKGVMVRVHTDADLFDISPVALPAFQGTETMLHSADMDNRQDVLVRARHRARRATWAT